MKFFNSKTRIGVVAALTLAVTIWGFNFLKGTNLFNAQKKYIILYNKVDGLNVSNAVTLRGLKVGKVEEIRFTDNQFSSLTVVISVDNSFDLPRGTMARIFSSDLMGSKSIDLIPGEATRILKDGDTLKSSVEESLSEQVKLQMLPLKRQAERLMGSMDSVLAVVNNIFNNDTKNNIQKTFSSIKTTFTNLEHSTNSIDTLVSSGQLNRILLNIELITSNLRQNNATITHIMNNMSAISDSVSRIQFAQTMRQIQNTFAQLEDITLKINSGKGTIGQLLNSDSVYVSLEKSVRDLDSLLVDINRNPKKYVHFSLIDRSPDAVNNKAQKKK